MQEIHDGTKETNSHWRMMEGHINGKPILLVDFDHTITKNCALCYEGDNCIQEGAKETLDSLHNDFQIWIYTGDYSLAKVETPQHRTIEAIKKILVDNKIPFDNILQTKPPSCFMIDDRAIWHRSWKQTEFEIKFRMNNKTDMWEETLKLVWQDPIQRKIDFREKFLVAELGGVIKALIYMQKYPEDYKIHFQLMKEQLGDLVAQIRAFCKSVGLSYEEIEDYGLRNLMDWTVRRVMHDK